MRAEGLLIEASAVLNNIVSLGTTTGVASEGVSGTAQSPPAPASSPRREVGEMGYLTSWLHETALPAEPTSACAAREFVRGHLTEHGLDSLVDDMSLVVSELATNAMDHARTPFVLRVEAGTLSVLLTVRDGSPELPHQRVPQIMNSG